MMVNIEWLVVKLAVGPILPRLQVESDIEEIGLDEVGFDCDV